ncbi:hypothetical protein COCCADRAFT_33405 [Bipolaris zeicola 26-R-13]|uniref:Uncharacterized protein n=1 Tax=Cochliobolus carbonum (strain 26-R-13) TaxID=930089 RepID=W6YIF9_COCC2|nr:uncharacterized protein COCCADRAFT_33405 [Bipolaris zeicola 26-R-13]EUC37310.1 hypothetical protein COCCADRAFT_33405 [Bipolaris zeicola 26-R-13]
MARRERAVAAVAGWALHFQECATVCSFSTVSGLRAKLVSAACGPYFAISRHSTRGGRSRDAIPTPRKGQKFCLFSCSPHLLLVLSIHPRPLVLTLPPRLRFTSLAFYPTPGQP